MNKHKLINRIRALIGSYTQCELFFFFHCLYYFCLCIFIPRSWQVAFCISVRDIQVAEKLGLESWMKQWHHINRMNGIVDWKVGVWINNAGSERCCLLHRSDSIILKSILYKMHSFVCSSNEIEPNFPTAQIIVPYSIDLFCGAHFPCMELINRLITLRFV